MDLSNPAQVKACIRIGLRLRLDPEPDKEERKRAFEFFRDECAYCGVPVEKGKGHLDHLLAASRDGSNHISNRVPSCTKCNSKEKGDSDWQEFLRRKCAGDITVFNARMQRIEQWVRGCGHRTALPESSLRLLKDEYQRIAGEYDVACRRIKKLESGEPE